MKGRKHTPEQIVRKLREGERLLGKEVAEVAKQLEICEATFHRWRNQYGARRPTTPRARPAREAVPPSQPLDRCLSAALEGVRQAPSLST